MTDLPAAREKISRARNAILEAVDADSFWDVIQRESGVFDGFRVLYASNAAGLFLQEQHQCSENLVPVFCKRYLLAWSDEISEVYRNGGTPDIAVASRPLVDTNLWSDLPRVLLDENFKSRDEAENVLNALCAYFGADKLDWTFGVLENMREACKPNNLYPLRKMAASLYYLNHGMAKIEGDGLAPYANQAKTGWHALLENDYMWHQVRRRDFIYLVVLKTFLTAWRGLPLVEGLREVSRYCLDELGTLSLKELYFSWKIFLGFDDSSRAFKAFSEPCMKTPKAETIKRLNSLAWDLFLFRWCETLMSEAVQIDRPNTFVFYVPAITTLDKPLLQVLRDCPLQAVLINYELQSVQTIFADEKKFWECFEEVLTPELESSINDEDRQSKAGQFPHQEVERHIAILEDEVKNLIAVPRGNLSRTISHPFQETNSRMNDR